MNKFLKIGTAAVFGALAAISTAEAALTAPETETFSFTGFGGSNALAFNGFNSGLGTLVEVLVSFTATGTLRNTAAVVPVGSGNQAVGSPTPLSATGTLNLFNFSLGIVLSSTITTPDFVGTVIDNNTVQTVGAVSSAPMSGSNSIVSGLASFIGGTNLYTLTMLGTASQSGSTGTKVLAGTDGLATGSVTIQYRYNEPQISTPEPASMVLVGAGLLGLGLARRRRRG